MVRARRSGTPRPIRTPRPTTPRPPCARRPRRRLEDVERPVGQHLKRQSGLLGTLRDPDGRLVEDHVGPVGGVTDEIDGRGCRRPRAPPGPTRARSPGSPAGPGRGCRARRPGPPLPSTSWSTTSSRSCRLRQSPGHAPPSASIMRVHSLSSRRRAGQRAARRQALAGRLQDAQHPQARLDRRCGRTPLADRGGELARTMRSASRSGRAGACMSPEPIGDPATASGRSGPVRFGSLSRPRGRRPTAVAGVQVVPDEGALGCRRSPSAGSSSG